MANQVEEPTPVQPVERDTQNEEKHERVASSQHDAHTEHEEDLPPAHEGGVTFQAIMAVISLCFVYNGYLFTLLMPGVVLPYINADLGPSSSYPWISIVWNLAASAVVTIGGRVTDIFGRRWFLLFGAALGAIGALIGALGKNIPQMIVAGVLMGFGGGFQEIIFATVQEVVPNNKRLIALGCLEVSNVFGMMSPLIATTYQNRSPLKWRACYWHAFACECFAFVALYFWYKPPSFNTKHREDGKSRGQLMKELDYVGVLLFTAGCVLILMALNWGGRDYPWKSAGVIAPIILSVVTFVALGLWEVYYPLKYPILPPAMFRNSPQFCAIVGVVFIGGMLYYSSNVLWPRQASLLFAPKDNPIIVGVYANIFCFGTILGAPLVLGIVPRVGHERWQMVGFLTIQTALIGSMASVDSGDAPQAIAVIMLVSATVAPVNFLAFGMASLALENQADIGVSQGILSTARLIGGAIATAIYTAIQQNRYAQVFAPRVTEAAASAGFSGPPEPLLKAATNGTAAAFNAVPGMTSQIIAAVQGGVKTANAQAFQLVYLVAIAFGAAAVLTALTTRDIPKSKKTSERAVQLENENIEPPPGKVVV